ncbi:MAG: Hpt domain-containing protein [Paracoccaceae bacterium]
MTAGNGAPDSWTQALLPQFLDMTASRQIEIDIERGNLEAGHDPQIAAREIGKIAHKIAGTAASFGFVGLGRQAQAVEAVCAQVCTIPGPELDVTVKMRLLPALDGLTEELDRALVSSL